MHMTKSGKILKWIEKEMQTIEKKLGEKDPEDVTYDFYQEGRYNTLAEIKQIFYE